MLSDKKFWHEEGGNNIITFSELLKLRCFSNCGVPESHMFSRTPHLGYTLGPVCKFRFYLPGKWLIITAQNIHVYCFAKMFASFRLGPRLGPRLGVCFIFCLNSMHLGRVNFKLVSERWIIVFTFQDREAESVSIVFGNQTNIFSLP